jgi:hypothetical protein
MVAFMVAIQAAAIIVPQVQRDTRQRMTRRLARIGILCGWLLT